MACGAAIENAHGFTNAEGGIWRSNRKCAHEFTNAEGESGLRACVYAGAPFVDLACTPPGWNLSPVNRVPLPNPGVRRSCILCAQSELSCAHQICHVRAVLGRAHERPKATMPPQGQPLPCSPRERTRLGRLAIHQKRGCAPPCTGHTLRTACSGACAHEMPSVDARAFTGVSLACDHAARLAPMPRLRRWR